MHFRRLRINFLLLLSGNGVSSLLGFATLAFNARALGPELLGVLALLQAFITIVSRLFSFDTWQPILKFGAEARARNDDARLRDVMVLGALYDLLGAVAASIVGFAIVFFGLPFFGIETQYQNYAAVFAATLLFGVTSSVSGLLRLYGHFGVITGIQVGVSASTLCAAVTLWAFSAPFKLYVLVSAGLIAAQSCAVLVSGVILWRRYHLPPVFAARFEDSSLRRAFLQFSWSTSALSSINVLRQNADAFLIAVLLGPAATGLYKVAAQIASMITRFGDPLQQALFPEIADLVAKHEYGRLRRILVQSFHAGTALLLVFVSGAVIFGDSLIKLVGGDNFADATAPLMWLSLAYGLTVSGFYIRPTVVTMIGPVYHLKTYIAATVAFMPALYLSINFFGIAGAGLGQVIFATVWFVLNSLALVFRLKINKKDLTDGLRQNLGTVLNPIKSPLSRVIGRCRLRGDVKIIAEIKQADRHVWLGYYDLPVISPDGSRVAYHSWLPGTDSVEFGTYEISSGIFQAIGQTRSWSFQFGTRLQFLSDDVVLHYEEKDGAVATCIRRLSDGAVLRQLDGVAYYSLSVSQSLMTVLNYSHIKIHRSGYGFDYQNHDVNAALTILDLRSPVATVVWRLELADCSELARCTSGDETIGNNDVHLNHALFSPDERRMAFVLAVFSKGRRQYLFSAELDNRKFNRCPLASASHYCWTSSDEISVFGRNEQGISGYWYWNIRTNELRLMGPYWPRFDGHQTRNPSHADLWVTDSYPDRLGYQSLYLIDNKKRRRIGSFYGPLGMAFDKCDLHPRWSPAGDRILVDSAYSMKRRILILSAPSLKSPNPTGKR